MSTDVHAAIATRYPPPAYSCFFEVGNTTGSYQSRRADAVNVATFVVELTVMVGAAVRSSVPRQVSDHADTPAVSLSAIVTVDDAATFAPPAVAAAFTVQVGDAMDGPCASQRS